MHELPDVTQGARIDWERVIMDIQRSAWLAGASSSSASLMEISRACGRYDTWAWQLKNVPGTEPRFTDGALLIGLWAEKTGGSSIPMLRRP